LLSISLSI